MSILQYYYENFIQKTSKLIQIEISEINLCFALIMTHLKNIEKKIDHI